MNEEKKHSDDFFNHEMSGQKVDIADLFSQVNYFLNHNAIEPCDLIVLNKLSKQLGQQNANIPRKVLRSMENKFKMIENKYQRVR